MARSLNKVTLIGNLTRDPELRYTPQGSAVCTFSIATNRQWSTDSGEKKEDVEYHRIVAWNKLAEICAQFLTKGRKTYVEGRLQTREWKTKEGDDRVTTEIVANEMIILDSKGGDAPGGSSYSSDSSSGIDVPESAIDDIDLDPSGSDAPASESKSSASKKPAAKSSPDDENEDIPF